MADDGRTYIRVHDGMPDHPKVETLSDRAFRLLVETWCWCSRHLTDGRVPRSTWNRRATAKVRRELVEAGLVLDRGADGVEMHDYLQHQRSRAVVEAKAAENRERRAAAAIKANHQRWHVGPGKSPSPDCELCSAPIAGASESDSDRTEIGSESESGRSPSGSHREQRTENREVLTLGAPAAEPDARTTPRRRPREHATPAELDATATSPAGYHLVQAWAQTNPGLTTGKRRELGKAVDQLLAQGADPALIPAALDAAHHSRFRNPTGALPHAYDDVRRARTPTAEPLHPTDVRIQALLQGTPTDLPPAIGGPS